MHPAAFQFVSEAIGRYVVDAPAGEVVEIGGRNINGTVRPLFGGRRYTSIDLIEGPGVDVVVDALVFEPREPAAIVVCCEVLEHAPRAEALVRRAFSWLKPGGVLIITAAGPGRIPHSAHDGGVLQDGEHYKNIRADELDDWLGGPEIAWRMTAENVAASDVYAIAKRRIDGAHRDNV